MFIIENKLPNQNPYSIAYKSTKKTKKNHPINEQVLLEPGMNLIDDKISDSEVERINKHKFLTVHHKNIEQKDVSEEEFIQIIAEVSDPNVLAKIKKSEQQLAKRVNVINACDEALKVIEEYYNKHRK